MLLEFSVRGQQIFRLDKTPLASDSRLYIAGNVRFNAEWDDITSAYLNFDPKINPEIGEPINVYLDNGAFDESRGVSLSAGTWLVSAHGTNTAGKEIHTTPLLLNVAQAGGIDGEAPPYVPPDAAGQIAAVAEEARDIAQSVRDDADAGLFKGEEGKPGLTPHIGENGNWFYGDEDSGIPAGAAGIKTDHTLSYTNGVLSVNTANAPEADNTLPITAAAVNTVVGNIETLLNKI